MYYSGTKEVRIYYCAWGGESVAPSHGLLKRAVETFLGEPLDAFSVCTDSDHGKPYIKELPDVHFSITHAGGFWACAVGTDQVGLDLQEVRDCETDRIAERFFNPSETEWLREHGSREDFFRIWAKKESYVKYTGDGLSRGLDYFSVTDGVPAFQREIPFRENFFLVLTTQREQDVILEELDAADRGKDRS